jgi:predicted nucleic-acid-binding Zn-ribbon protein
MAQVEKNTLVVRGKQLACVVCESPHFYAREIKMQTTGMTFFDLDWANKSAEGAICARCGYVHMFADGGLEWMDADFTL